MMKNSFYITLNFLFVLTFWSCRNRLIRNTHFFISNNFISNARLNWQKIKPKISNNLRLNFRYFKIIRFLHPLHPKGKGDIFKNVQKTIASVLTNFRPMFHLWINQVVGFYQQNVTLPLVLFKNFASIKQLPGFYISGTLVENGLMTLYD